MSGDAHWASVHHLHGNLMEYSASPIHAIPLFYKTYSYPEDYKVTHAFEPTKGQIYHPTKKYPIVDTPLFLSDLTNGYGMYHGTVEVNVEDNDPWYGLTFFSLTPAQV